MVSMVELEDGGGRSVIQRVRSAEVTRETIPSSPPFQYLGREKSRDLRSWIYLPRVEAETHGAVGHLGSLDLEKTVTIGPAQLGLTVDGEDVHLVQPDNLHQRNIEL